MRKIAIFGLFACAALGQRKPVTLEALQDFRSMAARDVPGEPVWAPDGKTFVYRQGRRLRLYDVAAVRSREVLDLSTLDAMAVPAPVEPYGWENRRVEEATLQWAPHGGEVLYASGGDLFLISIDGKWRQLVKTPATERDPKFSPDGTR
nr:hypothetical protein [Acidobacteriota bacterium]